MMRFSLPSSSFSGDTTGVVAIGLVDLRLQNGPHVPRLDTDHRQTCFAERAE
jgi:hypothetical protein